MYPTHSGVRTLEDQDLRVPRPPPSPLLPVQSPKPAVLAPDTSCSKVALMGGGGGCREARSVGKPLAQSCGWWGWGLGSGDSVTPSPHLPLPQYLVPGLRKTQEHRGPTRSRGPDYQRSS